MHPSGGAPRSTRCACRICLTYVNEKPARSRTLPLLVIVAPYRGRELHRNEMDLLDVQFS
jgi:hypothetical protein